MADGVVSIRGAQIAFSDEGAGPLVIRAHGVTQSRKTDHALGLIDWRMLPELGFRTISYDARGHGASTGNPEPDAYSWDALAEEDLMALVDHFSPHQPVRAIGITATILTAMTLAPERFTAVTLGASPTAWETRAPQGALYEQFASTAESSTPWSSRPPSHKHPCRRSSPRFPTTHGPR
jgi:pimeloyl-ACP methyl ester carboxylesterase